MRPNNDILGHNTYAGGESNDNFKRHKTALRKRRETGLCFFWKYIEKKGQITEACLSQWYECTFHIDNIRYNTAEQYMMAHKALLFDDEDIYKKIMSSNDPQEYKALGKQIHGFDQTVWDNTKLAIVLEGNIAKFSQNVPLKNYLLSTGSAVLAEASPYDAVWGIKLSYEDDGIYDPFAWKGQNLLGFLLMETRSLLGSMPNN